MKLIGLLLICLALGPQDKPVPHAVYDVGSCGAIDEMGDYMCQAKVHTENDDGRTRHLTLTCVAGANLRGPDRGPCV